MIRKLPLLLALAAIGLSIAALITIAAGQARAQERTGSIICRDWETTRVVFLQKHGESTVATGVTNNQDGSRVEVLASRDGDTFSVFRVYPDGVGCLIISGYGWEAMPDGSGDET